MKKISTENKIICQNENSMFNYFAWPTVGKLPDGNLAMVCSGFRIAHVDPFGKGTICYSMDEGKTWTSPAVFLDTPEDDRDCGIVTYGNGKVFINTFNNGIRYQSKIAEEMDFSAVDFSMDKNGMRNLFAEYTKCLDVDAADAKYAGPLYVESEDGGYTFGEIKKAPVQTPHGPCVTNEGNLLFIGNVVKNNPSKMECYTKTPDGDFTYLSTIPRPVEEGEELYGCEPHAIVLPSGKIVVHIRAGYEYTKHQKDKYTNTYQSVSTDGGKTFSDPVHLGLVTGETCHLLRHSSGVLMSVYGYRIEPYGIRVMFSTDEGETWDTDYILRDDGISGDLGYPATVELSDGSLLTVYYMKEPGKHHAVIMQSKWELPEKYRK